MDQAAKPRDLLCRLKSIKLNKIFHEKSAKNTLLSWNEQEKDGNVGNFRRSLRKMQYRLQYSFFKNEPSIKVTGASDNEMEAPKAETREPKSDDEVPLASHSWYWGPLSQSEANRLLSGAPDGSFLIRDSSSTSYLYSISFRCVGSTLHSRIERVRGRYRLFDNGDFSTIPELIENAIRKSENGIYCYTTNDRLADVNFPVRFVSPLSRSCKVQSLKFLCRFVVRQRTNLNDITKLPLPPVLHTYLKERNYFY